VAVVLNLSGMEPMHREWEHGSEMIPFSKIYPSLPFQVSESFVNPYIDIWNCCRVWGCNGYTDW
jgi:hypothetical protein